MIQSMMISDDNDVVCLSCLSKNGIPEKDWVWLEFKELKDNKYPEQTLVWDNPSFIFLDFLSFLYRWKERKMDYTDTKTFSEILPYLTENEKLVSQLIEIIEEAKIQEWE